MKTLSTHSRLCSDLTLRSGTALIVVLIVISLLTLGAYRFSESMLTEYHASDVYARQTQTRSSAQSGIEYVAALLTPDGGGFEQNLYDNELLFHVTMSEGTGFTIVSPRDDAFAQSPLRMGLIDESAKINLNVLADLNTFDADDTLPRRMLLNIPGMTEEIADSILDWIDSDSDVRTYGAEDSEYTDRFPRNRSIDSLEELLQVSGVTAGHLYGEDANRNGVLDPNENDGELSPPWDNSDGVLDLGWMQYLTVHSKESNFRHNYERFGEERLNLNEPLLAELYDTVEEELGEDIALFVTAYRLAGPMEQESNSISSSTEWNPLVGGRANPLSTGNLQTDEAFKETAGQLARNLMSGSGSVTRGGLDLTAGAQVTIQSLYELVDAQVEVEIGGQTMVLDSPWTSDRSSLEQNLPMLLDTFTLTTNPTILGRVNVNQAPLEVLKAVPEMPEGLAESIVSAQGNYIASGIFPSTTSWLVTDGLVDLPQMQILDRYLTARGDVYRMQVIGHASRGGPISRTEAIIDATESVPKILFIRDLAELGPGFRHDELPQFGSAEAY